MKLFSSLSLLIRVVLVGVLAGPALTTPRAYGQAAPGLDAQDFDRAQQATDAGKLEEAAGLYEGIPVKYPTSPYIPAATVRLGYVYFRLQQYDKAVKTLQAATALKGIPPEMAELALSLVPQAQSAKAVAEGPKSPQRKRLFEEAIKGFDAFLVKYPKSEEAESANYGKAVALYQIEQYDEALKPLRVNLTVFKQSEGVLDSQYLMALTMATIANNAAQSGKPADLPIAAENYKNAELMLGDIITKGTDVALANESRFQIGELNFARAGALKEEKDKEAQKALFQRAMDVYRNVAGKDLIVAAQKARIDRFMKARVAAVQQRDANLLKRFNRAIEREQEKLANIESRPDQTLISKVKTGQVFYQLDRLDECRVILGYVKPLIEDEEQKKVISYYYALSLARQNADHKAKVQELADRAEAVYTEFYAAYPAEPIAENLPVIMAAGFTSNPTKGLKYAEDLKKMYPDSKLAVTMLTIKVQLLVQDKKFDEAQAAITEALASNPIKEVAAAMKFNRATIYHQQKNLQEAIPVFKDVRDNYAGTEYAVQAQFFYPQLLLEAGDFKSALPELESFVKNNPKNELLSTALFFLGQAQVGMSQADEAIKSFKRLAEEFPQAQTAPFSYFSRAQLMMQKTPPLTDEVLTLMKQFMEKYPDAPSLFQAYDFVAQIQNNKQPKKADGSIDGDRKDEGKIEAIQTYEDFATKKPDDKMSAQALLTVAKFWKELTEGMGRWNAVRMESKPVWLQRVGDSIKAAERVVRQYPEEQQVALALALLLDDQKLLVTSGQIKDPDVEAYFQKLADEFKEKPETRSKIIFTIAGNLMDKDPAKAMELMASVYNPSLKYAPEDMDLYGTGLIDAKKLDEAEKLYKKLGEDYPNPEGKDVTQAPRHIQEAQSMMLFGLGKILSERGKVAEAKVLFDQLEANYGWSPKMLAAHLGIAQALFEEKKYEESQKRCLKVTSAGKAPPELRARGMFLLSENFEALGEYDNAINNFVKIERMYASVPKYAAGGLFRAAVLLEKQAKGELPLATPTPAKAPAKKPVPGAKPGAPGTPAPEEAPVPAATAAK